MKHIAILGIKCGWHCERLIEAFAAQGARAAFVTADMLTGRVGIPAAKPALDGFDALLIRGIPGGSLEQVIYRMDALYTLERRGLVCVNSPKTIEKTVDKYYTSALLEEAGLRVPPTVCCENVPGALEAYETLGGDVVYKPLFGSCGNGLIRLRTEAEAREAFERLAAQASVFYLQAFIPCSNSDIRAFVVDGRVIASMRRTGVDWRANYSLGGSVAPYVLSPDEEEMALCAAQAVCARVAGVDLLRADTGELYAVEVNGCPGWQGLSGVTQTDIAGQIAALLS